MSATICHRCRLVLRKSILAKRHQSSTRAYTPDIPPPPAKKRKVDIGALLSKPSWSVRSLLPSADNPPASSITPKQLHHLLRLSALPQPTSPAEESLMLSTLESQLHFLRDIQSVDTEGVEPLQSIRDETEGGIREATIGLEDLEEALAKEDIVGRNRRPRRRREVIGKVDATDWDVLGTASETVETFQGKYFVVRSGKGEDS